MIFLRVELHVIHPELPGESIQIVDRGDLIPRVWLDHEVGEVPLLFTDIETGH